MSYYALIYLGGNFHQLRRVGASATDEWQADKTIAYTPCSKKVSSPNLIANKS